MAAATVAEGRLLLWLALSGDAALHLFTFARPTLCRSTRW